MPAFVLPSLYPRDALEHGRVPFVHKQSPLFHQNCLCLRHTILAALYLSNLVNKYVSSKAGTRCLWWIFLFYPCSGHWPHPSVAVRPCDNQQEDFWSWIKSSLDPNDQIRVDISCGSGRESCLQSPCPDTSLIKVRNWTKGTCGLNLNTNGKLFGKQLLVKHTSENWFFSRLNVIPPV